MVPSDICDDMITWRRELHRFPELGFAETRTAARIAQILGALGLEVTSGFAGTGVIGALQGRRGPGPSIGLRAELDALPIQQQGDGLCRSEIPGVFHACGHDGHMAILLGAAAALARDPDFFGTAHFIFQPAEEMLNGGEAMIAAGLFDRFACDEIYALHNAPSLGVGNIALRNGAILGASDDFTLTVKGVGTHAAFPHFGVDAIFVAAALIQALQSVVSRSLDPTECGIVTIGQILGGSAPNIIADEVVLTGTRRAGSLAARELIGRRIAEICAGVASTYGAKIEIAEGLGCPPTVNAPGPVETVIRAARKAGANVITDMPTLMGAEDFSTMLLQRPGCYFLLGQGGPMIHHPAYAFDESIMPLGAMTLTEIVHDRLGQS